MVNEMTKASRMRVTRAWLDRDTRGFASLQDVDLDDMRSFVLDRWRERAVELGNPEPADLSSACKFSSLFVKVVLGGRVRGNYDHVFNLVDGSHVDLNEGAADVLGLVDPHRHDEAFLRVRDFHDSLECCMPRVLGWVRLYREMLDERALPILG